MRILDLFCGAGGAAQGYADAGFEVVGVDVKPQPRYPFAFVQSDALSPPMRLEDFDAIHASPPCQAYSKASKAARNRGKVYPDHIAAVRALLEASGRPFVIENVVGAPLRLEQSVRLCGSAFGLRVKRHRLFESNVPLMSNGCAHGWWDYRYPPAAGNRTNPMRVISPGYGQERKGRARVMTIAGRQGQFSPWNGYQGYQPTADEGKREMGCEWMTWDELREAIPPAYTAFLGEQLIQHLVRVA